MARWAWVIERLDGEALGELTEARGRSLDFDLRGPSSAKFDLDGRHTQALMADELTTNLAVYRNRVCLFRGRLGSTDDNLDADEHKINHSAVDYRGLLDTRIVEQPITYENTETADIAWDLVSKAQTRNVMGGYSSQPGDDLDITRGSSQGPHGVRDLHIVEQEMTIMKALDDLSESASAGFEWWIDPEKRFHTAWNRGVERLDFPLVYGTTVTKVQRQVDTKEYGNRIRVRGGTPDKPPDLNDQDENDPNNAWTRDLPPTESTWAPGRWPWEAYWVQRWQEPDPAKPTQEAKREKRGDRELWIWSPLGFWYTAEEMPSLWTDRWAPDLAERTERRIDRVHSNNDLKSQQQVDESAEYELARQGQIVPSYTMTLRTDRPFWDPSALWLGDLVEFHIRSGRLDVHDTDRVEQLSITIDEEGVEEITVTLGRRRSDLLAFFRTMPRRIETLERR